MRSRRQPAPTSITFAAKRGGTPRSLMKVVILAISLSALLMLPAALPGAIASAAPQHTESTKGFNVWNLSAVPTTLTSIRGVKCAGGGRPCQPDGAAVDGAPNQGAMLGPGQVQHFEVGYILFSTAIIEVTYSNGASFSMYLSEGGANGFLTDLDGAKVPHSCARSLLCQWGKNDVSFLDHPGTVINLPDVYSQRQFQTLQALCYTPSAATCDVSSASKQEIVKGQPTVAAGTWTNLSEDDVKQRFEVENTSAVSDEFGVKYSAEFEVTVFGQKVKNTITLAYKHDWSSSHTVRGSVEFIIRPHRKGWVTGTPKYYRDWVNFTISLGNTTWHLQDVWFDVPMTGPGSVEWEIWTAKADGGDVMGPSAPIK
jgi:hypothetical protein